MKKFLVVLLLCLGSGASAQNNLVLNGDFESYNHCPNGLDDIKAADFWTSIDTSGISNCSPEYLHVCATSPGCRVPFGGYFFQYPKSGMGMAQLQLFIDSTVTVPAYQDYLQGRLYKTLDAGRTYCVTFYVNLAEFSQYAISDVSAYLDDGIIDTIQDCITPQTKYQPQISYAKGPLSDTTNWLKVVGSFIAKGTERFITIGNFKDNVHTSWIRMPPNP